MILCPCPSPRPLIEAASAAAYEIREAARKMTLEKLERFMTPHSGASVGVLVSVERGQDGAFKAANFEVSAMPSLMPPNAFHCSMSLAGGYWQAEHDLSRAAEDFWFAEEVTRRLDTFGRELAYLTKEELEAISDYRHSLHETHGSKRINDAILIEVAKNERRARRDDSAHARVEAIGAFAETKEFLANEARTAVAWWDNLSPLDRSNLPDYDCEKLDPSSCAIFTYRDFFEKKRSRLSDKTCRVNLGLLQAAKNSRRKVSEKPPSRSVA